MGPRRCFPRDFLWEGLQVVSDEIARRTQDEYRFNHTGWSGHLKRKDCLFETKFFDYSRESAQNPICPEKFDEIGIYFSDSDEMDFPGNLVGRRYHIRFGSALPARKSLSTTLLPLITAWSTARELSAVFVNRHGCGRYDIVAVG